MKYLYFVRHGLSEMNKQNQWSGHTDSPLSPEGHEQAKNAGLTAKQQGLYFDLIVTSPLQRAHHTAKHIATHLGYPHENIMVNDLFKERHFGSLEGTNALSLLIGARYLLDESSIDKHEGVETLIELQKRANKAFQYLQSLEHDTVLVVSHGAFGRALYRSAHNLPLTKRRMRYNNAEIVKFL